MVESRAAVLRIEPVDREESDDDWTVVVRAQSDGQAFAVLYDRHVDPIYRYCYRHLRNVELAEDATSLAFMKALAALPRLTPGTGTFRAWLFSIAHNVLIDHARSSAVRVTRPLEPEEELIDPSPLLEVEVLATERLDEVGVAISRLPDDYRGVVELRLAGLTGPEIAQALGRSHGSVRTIQRRAIIRLRALLHVEPNEESAND